MPESDKGIDMNEVGSILRDSAENYDTISEKTYDAYDKLIAAIILIEKKHKYSPSDKEKKIKEIEKQINRFITTDDFGG